MYLPSNSRRTRNEVLGLTREEGIQFSLLSVQSSASANTYGSWVELDAATAFSIEELDICGIPAVTSNETIQLSVGLGSAGNEYEIASGFIFCCGSTQNYSAHWKLPIHIPAGSRICLRAMGSASNNAVLCAAVAFANTVGGLPGYPMCEPISAISSTRGVVIDPGATANTKGSWTQLVASTPRDYHAIQIVPDHGGDIAKASAAVSWLVDIGIGAGGSEQVLFPNLLYSINTNNKYISSSVGTSAFPASIPSGSRLACRAQCNVNTTGDRTFGMTVLGYR